MMAIKATVLLLLSTLSTTNAQIEQNPWKDLVGIDWHKHEEHVVWRARKIAEHTEASERLIDTKLLRRAVKSLMHRLRVQGTRKAKARRSLLGGAEGIHLVIGMKKMYALHKHEKARNIYIPHSLNPLDYGACLIVRECRGPKRVKFKKKMLLAAAKNVTVIPLKTIRRKHGVEYFERLLTHHKIFFADRRIWRNLYRIFGPMYFKRFSPIPISLYGKDWHLQCLHSGYTAQLTIHRSHSVGLRVGRTGMADELITRNVLAAANSIVRSLYPKKQWKAIKAMYLRTDNSIALPIFHKNPGEFLPLFKKYGNRSRMWMYESEESESEESEESERSGSDDSGGGLQKFFGALKKKNKKKSVYSTETETTGGNGSVLCNNSVSGESSVNRGKNGSSNGLFLNKAGAAVSETRSLVEHARPVKMPIQMPIQMPMPMPMPSNLTSSSEDRASHREKSSMEDDDRRLNSSDGQRHQQHLNRSDYGASAALIGNITKEIEVD
mmetsp:Transcript_31044/g.54506  ORF Transcript_31044/g.54506 Transcript_31044/m.54506 type:complete len:495 (+) Transcript_31044:247-1731(+)